MGKRETIRFFDALAPTWDAATRRNEASIERIMAWADICKGARVLDVGCGTGILFPDYFKRGAAQVTGIDISPAMIARAKEKYQDPRLVLLAADAQSYCFETCFDRCVVYNVFPHICEPAHLFRALSGALVQGGRLIVAHGMGRDAINARHRGIEEGVCSDLPEALVLARLFEPYFKVDLCVSEEEVYAVSGVRI